MIHNFVICANSLYSSFEEFNYLGTDIMVVKQ